jgi:hypothetical protein
VANETQFIPLAIFLYRFREFSWSDIGAEVQLYPLVIPALGTGFALRAADFVFRRRTFALTQLASLSFFVSTLFGNSGIGNGGCELFIRDAGVLGVFQ